MDIKTNHYSRLVFWLKTSLVISAILLSSTIFIFSYSKKLNTEFSVITNDVRIGLKYQARNAHVKGNTDDGGVFDFHVKALNPSHKNDNIIILSRPLGKLSFSDNERFNLSSDFASLNMEEQSILFNGNLSITNSWGTSIRTEELYADLKKKLLFSSKPISAETNFGLLESGGMRYLYGDRKSAFNEEIFFINGVKLELLIDG